MVFVAEKIVTVGCIKGCPITPPKKTIEWELDDPSSKSLDEFRRAGDIIRERVLALIDSL